MEYKIFPIFQLYPSVLEFELIPTRWDIGNPDFNSGRITFRNARTFGASGKYRKY